MLARRGSSFYHVLFTVSRDRDVVIIVYPLVTSGGSYSDVTFSVTDDSKKIKCNTETTNAFSSTNQCVYVSFSRQVSLRQRRINDKFLCIKLVTSVSNYTGTHYFRDSPCQQVKLKCLQSSCYAVAFFSYSCCSRQ